MRIFKAILMAPVRIIVFAIQIVLTVVQKFIMEKKMISIKQWSLIVYKIITI